MTDLLPCPFCGQEPKPIVDATRLRGVHVLIHRCKVVGPITLEGNERRIVEAWNTRGGTP